MEIQMLEISDKSLLHFLKWEHEVMVSRGRQFD